MKIKSDMGQVMNGKNRRRLRSETVFVHRSPFVARRSERGMALVITLILLSVTLVMAIAFLAISRRERASVVTSTDTATARLAADSALASAEAQIIANVLVTTNPYNFGLLVSTNYINPNGFLTGVANPTNVNYTYTNGNSLTADDSLINLGNLFLTPRPPVFIVTNQQTGTTEFRFYLDLNRNGIFEPSGVMPTTNNAGQEVLDGNNNPIIANNVGDPQWIGVLERPDATHGPNNKFLSRYAFIALPAGNTLDLNYIHNQAFTKLVDPNPTNSISDGFMRNQGVGSWEINLAAFLTDLNTNQWETTAALYTYLEPAFNNTGFAFQDALSLLSYRYGYDYASLATANNYFTNTLNYPNNVDAYSDGPLQTTLDTNEFSDTLSQHWLGADNTNHFFNLSSELFDANKSSTAFVGRLSGAGGSTNLDTYDRYTFYRLLAQLGTDSAPENKMNLNYDNLDAAGNVIPNAQTNLIAWTPIRFFTNAADRLLRLYTTNWFQSDPSNFLATYYGIKTNYYYTNPDSSVLTNDPTGFGLTNVPYFGVTNQMPVFGITNIPVFVNGSFVYSSAVNRLLQLAANIYDATTNKTSSLGYDFPSVFRPVFNEIVTTTTTNIYIIGFDEVTNVNQADLLPLSRPFDLKQPTGLSSFATLIPGLNRINVFGVPMIIGAKKGLPNFNQFAMQNTFQITRKIQLTRATTNSPPSSYQLNQMFAIGSAAQSGMANQLEVQCWNSYSSNYTNSTDISVTNWLTMTLTNDEGFSTSATFVVSGFTNITTWPAYNPNVPVTSFVIPLPATNIALLPANSIYRFNVFGTPYVIVDTNQSLPFETNVSNYPQPHWWLTVTNNLQVAMVDRTANRLIDYVQLSGPNSTRDLTVELQDPTKNATQPLGTTMWLTNPVSSGILPTVFLPGGIEAQLQASRYIQTAWNVTSVNGFNNFVENGLGNGAAFGSTNLEFEPYSPANTMYQITTWQANDPLVHYMAADLFDSANTNNASINPANPLIGTQSANERYQPWGRSVQMADRFTPDISPFYLAIKDPLIWSSDFWDFPTNKLPTVGWLGRVHRGTPWQTVYLKASNVLKTGNSIWANWTGNFNTNDAANASPTQDRLLFDVFTTALNDNATRGQLSVNVASDTNNPVAGLAAWSAVFSGVMVLSNNGNDAQYSLANQSGILNFHRFNPSGRVPYAAQAINPAGVGAANSPLWQLVTNINSARANFTNADGLVGAFEHIGNILSAPQFAEHSPFLNWIDNLQATNGISDEMYEWLPQQTMSLLRCPTAPRYVIYSYGQTLKPAPNGVVTSGGKFFGMITNYQVVAETATRTVLRVDDAQTSHPHIVIESYNILPPD